MLWSLEWGYLGLRELPEHGGQPIVIDVTVGLNSNVQDVDRFIQHALQLNRTPENVFNGSFSKCDNCH